MCNVFNEFLWIFPGLIGFIIGLSELLNRYNSFEKLFNTYSIIYMLINCIASILVYFIFKIYDIKLGEIGKHDLGQILVAGIGAMAFLRSSFFNYKTSNDKVIEVGPAAFLSIFLNAAQRQFDQTLSEKNLTELESVMYGINFVSASKDLPIIILSTMRVLSNEEQKELSNEILKLVNDINTSIDVKNLALGVILLKYTGMPLLRTAVKILNSIYNNNIQADLKKINDFQAEFDRFRIRP
jgi:hypothetical protein